MITEVNPLTISIESPSLSTETKLSRQIPKRYKGPCLKNQEAKTYLLEGLFGKLLNQEVSDKDWKIGLVSLSCKEPITLNLCPEQPTITICCVLEGNTSVELPAYGKVLLNKNRYGIYYLPGGIQIPISFDEGNYLAVYISLSSDFFSTFAHQDERLFQLFDMQRNDSKIGKAISIFRIGIEERKIIDAIRACSSTGIAKYISLHARILDLLGCYFCSLETAEASRDQTHDQYQRILESQEYIQRNYFLPLKITAISKRTGINMRTYEKLFKEIFSMGPREYIEQVRVRKAVELLKTTKTPITSIGHQVGISGHNYFSVVFGKIHGCSPREYRQKWIENNKS